MFVKSLTLILQKQNIPDDSFLSPPPDPTPPCNTEQAHNQVCWLRQTHSPQILNPKKSQETSTVQKPGSGVGAV